MRRSDGGRRQLDWKLLRERVAVVYVRAGSSNSAWKQAPVLLLTGLYVIWFSLLSLRSYWHYIYPPFDLGIFDQGLWLLSHFHSPFVTLMGRNLFGDHTSFILLPVAVIYRLFPEPQGILVLQALVIGVTALPIYFIARKLIGSATLATLLAAAFLLNPALQQGNMEQFHPEAFQVLIITLAIYAAIESRGWLLAITVVLALLVKEDSAALVVPLGVWVLCRRNRRWGSWIIGGSVVYALLANFVIIPGILGASSIYGSFIPFGGVGGFLDAVVRTPGQVIAYFGAQGRPYYVWQLGFTAGWGFVLAPEIALIAVLVVFENVLSGLLYQQSINYHYSLAIVPVLILGVVWAVSRQKSARRRRLIAGVTFVCALWSCVIWGLAPFSDSHVWQSTGGNAAEESALAYVEQGIPAGATVSAYYTYISHIEHRTRIYLWPNPFVSYYWGLPNGKGAKLPPGNSIQYLMLPYPYNLSPYDSTFNSIANHYTLVRSRDGVALYQRTVG